MAMPSLRRRRARSGCMAWVFASLAVGTGAFGIAPSARTRSFGGWRQLHHSSRRSAVSQLYGVPEWKAGQPDDLRQLGFLPFPVDDVMCPGETKALHLYEARFLALFEAAVRDHGGCVGGAIFVDDGVLVRVGQLCDIVAWEREEVGVSVAVRCIGRVEIADVVSIDPYIQATVREVLDTTDSDPRPEESNSQVSSDVFSLHRQCVEIEAKMAAVSGIGWEGDGDNADPAWGRPWSSQEGQQEEDGGSDVDQSDESDGQKDAAAGGDNGSFLFGEGAGEEEVRGPRGGSGGGDDDSSGGGGDDLMERFEEGGGELDLSQGIFGGGGGVDMFARELVVNEDGEEEEERGDGGDGEGRGKGLDDLLWGHESWTPDGFDTSLEEQVDAMYACLKADLGVSLDDSRGGQRDDGAFKDTAPFGGPRQGEGDGPWEGVRTIAELIAASEKYSNDGKLSNAARGGGVVGDNDDGEMGAFLWGCASRKEERDQLVSFVSLGCFDPSARLQSLILLSTGQRLRMSRDALAERLKVLVAKSALSQLGD